jgi:hypothetical protein
MPLDFSELHGSFRLMNENLEAAVAAWLREFDLPDGTPGIKDLAGRTVRLARFREEETCRFFFPLRTLLWHQRMAKAVAGGILRKRGAKVVMVDLTPEDFARWLEREHKTDTAGLRFQFATRPPA